MTTSSDNMLFSPAASSIASASIELDVHWEPASIRSELRMAIAILSQRGLKLASKWAAGQLVGIGAGEESDYAGTAGASPSLGKWADELVELQDHELYSKSLLEAGEYLHAAAVLSKKGASGSVMPGPLENLSKFGIYLRAYSLYMAGERKKEEDSLELQSGDSKPTAGSRNARNPYLSQLLKELYNAHQNFMLDSFGLYVYGLVLKDAGNDKLSCEHSAASILAESLLLFPYNWSAWLDISGVIMSEPAIEQHLEQILQPSLASHYMYHFFCAHLMASHHQAHEDALVLYERLYEPMPNNKLFQSEHIKSQLGVVHYHLREFQQALDWFNQNDNHFSLESKDVLSNILYVKEDQVALSNLAHQAVFVDKYRPETCCIIGNYYSLKQQRHKAVKYFQRALKLDSSYTSAWTLMGHEYVELKQTESAMETYRRAVTVSSKDYRAWYGLGQTYEFLNMHLYALFYYRKACALRPYDSRMWCSVGLCLVALSRPADAIRAYERAVSQGDTEGIATQKLASLYRQEGRDEEAAQCYLRHLESRYLVTNKAPARSSTLDTIVQGVLVEASEAEALIFLANYYKSNGENDTAALMCSRLVDYPGPEKEQAKGILRDLRSRSKTMATRMTTRSSARAQQQSESFLFSP